MYFIVFHCRRPPVKTTQNVRCMKTSIPFGIVRCTLLNYKTFFNFSKYNFAYILRKVNFEGYPQKLSMENKGELLVVSVPGESGKGAMQYGISLARRTRKRILFFSVHSPKDSRSNEEYAREFKNFADQLCLSQLVTNYETITSSGNLIKEIHTIAESRNVSEIVLCMPAPGLMSHFTNLSFMKQTRQLQCPFVIIPSSDPAPNQFQNLYLPIGHRLHEKEKVAWAKSFSEQTNANIIIIPAKAQGESSARAVSNNLNFARKILDAAHIPFQVTAGNKSIYKIEDEAIQIAGTHQNGLVVITTTPHYGPDQELLGPPEMKLITNKQKVPIVCINPRKLIVYHN